MAAFMRLPKIRQPSDQALGDFSMSARTTRAVGARIRGGSFDFGIHGRQAAQGVRILNDDDGTGLDSLGTGGIHSGLEDEMEVFVADLGFFVFSDTPPVRKGADGFVHKNHSLKSCGKSIRELAAMIVCQSYYRSSTLAGKGEG